MKRIGLGAMCFLLIVALVSGMVAGCGGSTETADKEAVKFKIGHCTW